MKTIKEYLGKVSITCNGLWDVQREYDRLCLVHDGFFASYISRKSTPAGTALTNTEYWQPVANLRDDVRIHAKDFEDKVIELLAQIQIKLKNARIVVKDIAERDSLTINDVAPGCEVYVLETKQSWILDSIVCSSNENNNWKEWHLEIDSKIDSEEKYELEGTFDTLTADRAICDAYGNIIHDTYITRETVHNYIDNIINEFLSNWKYEIQDGTITYDMLSEALKQFIGSNGNVTNMADEEDLTVVDNQLKLKDREYKEAEFSGKGYKILRKNWMDNVNLLEQSMINEANTVYELRYLFYLNGKTITMPANSVLYLNGGQINNGTIQLNETLVKGIHKLSDFGTATITGTFAKGQLMFVDAVNAECYWNGEEWVEVAKAVNNKDYPLPLGEKDNLFFNVSCCNINNKQVFQDDTFIKDEDNLVYGARMRKSLRVNNTVNFARTWCLTIKKNDNPNRTFQLNAENGTNVTFKQDVQLGPMTVDGDPDNIRAYVIANTDSVIKLFSNSSICGMEQRLYSYSDNTKTTHDKLEIDLDRTFIIAGIYNQDELDLNRKYYTRAEKHNSHLIGKNALIFADSLSYFSNALMNEYGMNVYTIANGGNQLGYGGNYDNWILSNDKIQSLLDYKIKHYDYIIFAMGANDGNLTTCDEETLKFVLNNKRWFDNTNNVETFDSLEPDNKQKFSMEACLYAASYTLAKLYPNAIIAVVPPYRTPGKDCTDYNIDTFASVLYNGRFIEKTNILKSACEKLGAIFIPNQTRDNAATAPNYHETDGVHPPFSVAADMASNIFNVLNNYHDSFETVINN